MCAWKSRNWRWKTWNGVASESSLVAFVGLAIRLNRGDDGLPVRLRLGLGVRFWVSLGFGFDVCARTGDSGVFGGVFFGDVGLAVWASFGGVFLGIRFFDLPGFGDFLTLRGDVAVLDLGVFGFSGFSGTAAVWASELMRFYFRGRPYVKGIF